MYITYYIQMDLIKRRQDLCATLQVGLIIIDSAKECYFNHDCAYLYRQDSTLYYYCPIEQPHSTLVIENNGHNHVSHLFIERADPKEEVWTGKKHTMEGAKQLFQVDFIYGNEEVNTIMDLLMAKHMKSLLYFHTPDTDSF